MSQCHYVVTVEVEPSREAEWNDWHSEHHVREMVTLPGFVCARKLKDEERAPDGWVRYVTEYILESREALEGYLQSPHRDRLRGDHAERFGKVTRLSRQSWLRVADFER